MKRIHSFEQLGITPFDNLDDIYVLSDPIIEAALKSRDIQLARSAFMAIAEILQKTGHVSPSLATSFIWESEQKIADLE